MKQKANHDEKRMINMSSTRNSIIVFLVLFSGCYLLNPDFLALFGFCPEESAVSGQHTTCLVLPENDIVC